MARSGLSSAIRTEIVKGSLRAAFILKLDFPGGAINTTQAGFAISYGGDVYANDGRLIDISGINERTDGKAGMLSLSLSPDTTVRARVAANDWKWSKVYPRLVFMGADYAVLDVYDMPVYYMSTAQHQIDTRQASIRIECEPLIVDLSRHNPVFPSSRDQALRSPGDTYFDSSAAIQGARFEWGGVSHLVPGKGGHPGGGGGHGSDNSGPPGRNLPSQHWIER